MSLEGDIQDAIDAWDTERAALLAAGLSDPVAYQRTMERAFHKHELGVDLGIIPQRITGGHRQMAKKKQEEKKAAGGEENFELESPIPGIPPAGVVEELRHLRRVATDSVTDYAEALKLQAEKHKLKRGALRRYIAALETDKTEDAREEARDLERLIEAI